MYENLLDELEPEDLEHFEEEGLTDLPEDYYFAIDPDINGDMDAPFVVITPRKIWDNERRMSDSGWIPGILEDHLDGYYELLEATFELPEGKTEAEVRADLTDKGFVENTDLLTTADD